MFIFDVLCGTCVWRCRVGWLEGARVDIESIDARIDYHGKYRQGIRAHIRAIAHCTLQRWSCSWILRRRWHRSEPKGSSVLFHAKIPTLLQYAADIWECIDYLLAPARRDFSNREHPERWEAQWQKTRNLLGDRTVTWIEVVGTPGQSPSVDDPVDTY